MGIIKVIACELKQNQELMKISGCYVNPFRRRETRAEESHISMTDTFNSGKRLDHRRASVLLRGRQF